ncbi:MAG: hypothetical protein PHP00_05055 [Thiotrichaceae bacterium]|nr:hypothetical protein [Thiotrichaceae bacterium]
MNQFKKQPKLLMLAMGVAIGGTQAAEANVFQQTDLAQGYMQVAENTTTAPATDKTTTPAAPAIDKAKEAKCGAKKSTEGKCGEAKCGAEKSKEAKCGADKSKEGKCGEAKCGADKKSADTPKEEAKPAETKPE